MKKTSTIALADVSYDQPMIPIDAPESVYITLGEMRTRSYTLNVQEGDQVQIGTQLGVLDGGFFTQPVLSTVSGTVGTISKKFIYSGKVAEVLEVKNDFKDTFDSRRTELTDDQIKALSKEEIIELAKNNAVKGLGGAGFPTYIKFQTTDPINTLVINGVECEPFLSSDSMALLKDTKEIFKGIEIALQACSAKRVIFGVKKKHTDLIKAVEKVKKEHFAHLPIEIKAVDNIYPQGWENFLVKATLGIHIPPRKLVSKYGVLILNVTTAYALHQAVRYNMPIYERYFTMAGDAFKNPGMLKVRVGETVPRIVKAVGGYTTDEDRVLVMGGPLMGANLLLEDGVISMTVASMVGLKEYGWIEEPCIRCSACVYSCPVDLQPVNIMYATKNKDHDAVAALGVDKCIECGLCAYVCPSKIQVTDYMRKGKKLL
jgi:electron transport complex protein RnfC